MKVALYVRVSTEEQAKDGFSIEGQIDVLTDHCRKNGDKVFAVYKDDGFSGKNMKRPALTKMLEDAEHRLFDVVFVWKINRISRKQLHLLQIFEKLEQNHIIFKSHSESIDLSKPAGRAMMQVMGTFAEFERNQIVENVKMGMNQRAKEGKWNGGFILGYQSENKQLVIVEHEAQIVRHIFDLYVSGIGFKAIANRLNHEGYKTKRGNAFAISTIRDIILNPTYAGYTRFNQYENWETNKRNGRSENMILSKGIHTPIIDLDTWHKAQSMLEQKSHKPVKSYFGSFPLTTLLRCPQCGHGMISHKVKKGDRYIRYYQCGNFHSKGSAVCRSNTIRADYAEETVFKKLERVTSDEKHLRSIVDRVNSKISTIKEPLVQQMKYIDEQMKRTKMNLEKYLTLFENGKLSQSSTITEKILFFENELADFEDKKRDLERELSKPTIKEVSFEQVHALLSQFSTVLPKVAPEKQKDLLHTIINQITVNPAHDSKGRTIKDVELFFDTTKKDEEFVLTCGTVPPARSETPDTPAPTKLPLPSDVET